MVAGQSARVRTVGVPVAQAEAAFVGFEGDLGGREPMDCDGLLDVWAGKPGVGVGGLVGAGSVRRYEDVRERGEEKRH